MIVYNRPRPSMGYLGQELNPIAEVLKAPSSSEAYIMLVFAGMSKLQEGLELVRQNNLPMAKVAIHDGPESAAHISGIAASMLEGMLHRGEISENRWTVLQREFGFPFLKALGEVGAAYSRGQSGLLRFYDEWKAFLTRYESTMEVFFKNQSAKINSLYSGIRARISADEKFLASIMKAPVGSPVRAYETPIRHSVEMGLQAKTQIEKNVAEVEITPAMLEKGLGSPVVKAAFKLTLAMVGKIFAKFGWKKTTAFLASHVMILLYKRGVPLLWQGLKGVGHVAVGAWIFDDVIHVKQAREAAAIAAKESGNKTTDPVQKKDYLDIVGNAELSADTAKQNSASAAANFPEEAALFGGSGSDNVWVLYALGGGALALGVYLYYSNKKQN